MPAQRILTPLTSSSSLLFRFASSTTSTSLRPCQHILRQFSSTPCPYSSSKRKMQTSTAYQPYSLEPQPPPPRNAGVPDTSIAGDIPQVKFDTRPPKMTGQHEIDTTKLQDKVSSISVTELEAQKSKPIASASAAPQPRARPKLRARKSAMNLTPTAVAQLRALLDQPQPKLIKVGVRNRGCSGLAYHLEYVEKPGAFDEEVVQDGVKCHDWGWDVKVVGEMIVGLDGMESSFPPIRACLFDMDGLLIDSEDILTLCHNLVLTSYSSPPMTWAIKSQLQGRPAPIAISLLLAWANLSHIPVSEYKSRVDAEHTKHFPQSKPLPGVVSLLEQLKSTEKAKNKKEKIHMALATSSHRDKYTLKTSHLSSLFSLFPPARRILGDDPRIPAGRGKPSPDIYLLALRAINESLEEGEEEVKPEECLVFEDSVPGVEAGRRADRTIAFFVIGDCRVEIVNKPIKDYPETKGNRTPAMIAAIRTDYEDIHR
ncbi:hypothetical protein B7494_g1606 [Chlorociboria aeruginascens]|nr:hypothetical protein B7494_g1606 [Chlorociboria aeruginascens]